MDVVGGPDFILVAGTDFMFPSAFAIASAISVAIASGGVSSRVPFGASVQGNEYSERCEYGINPVNRCQRLVGRNPFISIRSRSPHLRERREL